MVVPNRMGFIDQKLNNRIMKQFKIQCMKGLILILAIISMSCNGKSKHFKQTNSAMHLKLYKIAETPTLPEEQLEGKDYILDYEILSESDLSYLEKRNLKQVLKKKENFTNENIKKCPFIAKYAISMDDSGIVIVSVYPCAKVIISTKNGDKQYFDLVDTNLLEEMLDKLVNK